MNQKLVISLLVKLADIQINIWGCRTSRFFIETTLHGDLINQWHYPKFKVFAKKNQKKSKQRAQIHASKLRRSPGQDSLVAVCSMHFIAKN